MLQHGHRVRSVATVGFRCIRVVQTEKIESFGSDEDPLCVSGYLCSTGLLRGPVRSMSASSAVE